MKRSDPAVVEARIYRKAAAFQRAMFEQWVKYPSIRNGSSGFLNPSLQAIYDALITNKAKELAVRRPG